MKTIFTTLLITLISIVGFAQTYNSPESIEFDYANDRWLIANNSGNNILARSNAGILSVFIPSVTGPHGLEIVGDTLYVCSGSTLKAYNINTAAVVFSINLGATFLNGITHDADYLYITDFSSKKIYRFNMSTHTYSVFVTGLAKSPNGIIYDQPNNRCVFVNWGNAAPIMAFDVTTGVVSTLATTSLGNCDGIAKDGAGNYYVSSWSLNGISRFNNTFTGGPTTVVTGLSNPADIFYNVLSDTLGVPNSGALNNTTYHNFGVTSIIENKKSTFHLIVNPNPVINTTEISYTILNKAAIHISLIDSKGKLVKTIAEKYQVNGVYNITIDLSGISGGNYFLVFSSEGKSETKQLTISH